MREIKFRAWEESAHNMHPNVESGVYEDPDEIIEFDRVLGLARFEVMQFTGLKDKNGLEIYENDIVKASFWNDDIKIVSEIASVEFEDGSFVLRLPRDEWSYFNGAQSIEVIGNIYENPELLEVESK